MKPSCPAACGNYVILAVVQETAHVCLNLSGDTLAVVPPSPGRRLSPGCRSKLVWCLGAGEACAAPQHLPPLIGGQKGNEDRVGHWLCSLQAVASERGIRAGRGGQWRDLGHRPYPLGGERAIEWGSGRGCLPSLLPPSHSPAA